MRNWKGYFIAWLFGLAMIATIANAWAIGGKRKVAGINVEAGV